tara:strand:- start:874 stop:1587 length:714 start_codon:yes stop_codon:yes gene_type:complete
MGTKTKDKETKNETALAIKDSAYLLFKSSAEDTAQAIKVNIGGGGMEVTGLPRMAIPSAGGLAFDYPTIEGSEPKKEVEGVIVSFNDFRAYWASEFDGGQSAPDCFSNDLQQGIGEPGGDCNTCSFSQWGSAEKGNGQACTLKRKLLFIPEDRTLPIIVDAPPSSLQNIKAYFLNLCSYGKKFYHIVTKFSLEVDKNPNQIKYSKIKLSMVRELDEAEKVLIDSYVESIESSIGKNN